MNVSAFYADDPRRQSSGEVTYGRGWRDGSHPGSLYTLRWIAETREIYLMRAPYRPTVAAPVNVATAGVYHVGPEDIEIELLGWAEDQDVLDEALDGWERYVGEPDSIKWVRRRLGEAAAKTEEKRGGRSDRSN